MKFKESFVITISREVGSGGRTIGRKLAERLDINFFDKELIKILMKRFDLNAQTIEEIKGEKQSWLSDFIRLISPMPAASSIIGADSEYGKEYYPEVTSGEIYKAEAEILRGLADEGACVIAGRSGFHILKDRPNVKNIFITASKPNRIERIMARQGVSKEEAEDIMERVDESRENYIKRFTGSSRYDTHNYDLALNVDGLTEDQAVDVILAYLDRVF
jgi:cytidylate kinase